MKVTYYGHSCFGVHTKGKDLLFDPFITGNELAGSINPRNIPADYILISHGHFDHMGDAAAIAHRTGATIVSNFEITQWFAKQRLEKIHGMNRGGGYPFDFGRVTFTNAIHSSSMPDGAYGGNPGGFLVEESERSFYYSGDTALTMDMKLIGEFHRIDFACLPIGDNFTMGIDDSIRAAQFVNARKVLALHYNTFPPIRTDLAQAKDKFSRAGIDLVLLNPGQSAEF